jgi:hypothetical protein
MGSEHRLIGLQDLRPGGGVWVVAVIPGAARGSLVEGDDVGVHLPKQVSPIAGTCPKLDHGTEAPKHLEQAELRPHVRIAAGQRG